MLDLETGNNTANKIFSLYDKDQSGELTPFAVQEIMRDLYRMIGKDFRATRNDVSQLFEILDADDDGKVSFDDIQTGIFEKVIDPGNVSSTKGSRMIYRDISDLQI